MGTISIPSKASAQSWGNSVGSAADLPATGYKDELRYVSDTQSLYAYNGEGWTKLNNGGGNFNVERIVLTELDINNKYVTLAHIPLEASDTELTVIGGSDQDYSVDFIVEDNKLKWNTLSLDGVLAVGDILKINYPY